MTIPDAIAHLGVDHVQAVLDSGRAYDTGTILSFDGRAFGAWTANLLVNQAAYATLAGADELSVMIAARDAARAVSA